MYTSSTLVNEIISSAARKGISQKDLAIRAKIAPETLSRLKRAGNPSFSVLARLADASGVHIGLVRGEPAPASIRHKSFRERHKALAWSNSKASPETLLRTALLQPRFPVLLDAALEFGISRIRSEWQALIDEDSTEARRAAPRTERILRNIEHGFQQAAA